MSSFRNVVLYGAGGQNVGQAILNALLEDGSFQITILARRSSRQSYPTSLNVVKVGDDLPHDELVAALKGQDVVISLVGAAGVASQTKVIDAAIAAGVSRFIPSEWGFDNNDTKLTDLSPVFRAKRKIQEHLNSKIQEHPSFSWNAIATSIWLEWALNRNFLSIDPVEHTVAYWDNGTYAPSHTTLPYVGKATVEVLKHPDETKNKRVYTSGFAASQREIVAELEKQQGVTYTVQAPINGAQKVKNAQDQWDASGETDYNAAYVTVEAAILMEQYGANHDLTNKQPRLEKFAQMPKLNLEEVVREVVNGQRS